MVEGFGELTGLQIDALKEIGNVGAGNAATALAQMLGAKIDMDIPMVSILPFTDVPNLIGGPDMHVVGLYLSASGSAPCSILFILPIANAVSLANMLIGGISNEAESEELTEIKASAMMELGNIIAATYLNALSMFTGLDFIPSVPALGVDMAGAILDAILAQFGEIGDHILMLETEFKKDDQEVVGNFFLLPEPGALNKILSALGVNN